MTLVTIALLGLFCQDPAPQEEPAPAAKEAPAFQEPGTDRAELCPRLGFVLFSEDFEADPEVAGSLFVRASMPWLSLELGGAADDTWGGFAELTFTSIDRELTPPVPEPDGSLFFVSAGLDYKLYGDDRWMVRAEAGVQYGRFGDVTDLDDGFALRLGVNAGWRVAENIWITVDPHGGFGDGGDHILFLMAGVHIRL